MDKISTVIELSQNNTIEPVRWKHLCYIDNFPAATCPCAALEESHQKIFRLEGENAALKEALQEFARVKAQNAELKHISG